jgi:uncharacterized membrane protein
MPPEPAPTTIGPRRASPFRRTVLRGLGVLLPPVLTVVILIWAWNTIHLYVLDPLTALSRDAVVWYIADVREDLEGPRVTVDGRRYAELNNGTHVPVEVYDLVRKNTDRGPVPSSGQEVYRRYVEIKYFKPHLVVPVYFLLFIVVMYLLGRFIAAGVGRFFWGLFEGAILHLPLVRKVYAAVKQVTDFMVSEKQLQVRRIVAVEYPRKGMWAVGFVTSEGLSDIREAAGEPIVTVMISSSPWTVSGWIVTALKSETIDLDMTVDEAVQFIVSCGVVIPPRQLAESVRDSAELGRLASGRK